MRARGWIGLASSALGATCCAQGTASSKPSVILNQLQSEQLPDSFRMKLLVWISAVALMGSLSAYLTRRFDWQHRRADQTCGHCRAVHIRTGTIALVGDTTATIALFYLIALPFAAALREDGLTLTPVATTILMLLAFILIITASGSILRMLNLNPHRSRDSFFVGLRLIGFTVGSTVLLGGLSVESVAANLTALLGPTLGERLLADIGAGPVRDSALALTGGIAISVLMRWVLPFLFGSRPLALVRNGANVHMGLQVAKA